MPLGRVWLGERVEGRRTAFHGRRLRGGRPALQDGGSDCEEAECREGGAVRRSNPRGADLRVGKLPGPRWLYCQSSSGRRRGWVDGGRAGASLAGHECSQALPIKWAGGRGLGGRAGGS